ncbi:BofC C-terminal domain-containing protein [Paenibacillus xerothermodurans]|uniref:Bypass-of-forespore protein C n=1 Tax=Paenibacillus xerothermodurans TaxID=1977292 RepID=A0A2W1NIU6_PAEXE|nr:BofC C-terminal domain-containing protein [Paenibacillus xerothermodurans]PZE19445.1 bypass-of-forespore protein C [Paenibacillus xerothermodurans]
MILLSLLSKLKRKLRWKRRWLMLGALLLLTGMGSIAAALMQADHGGTDGSDFTGRDQPVFKVHANTGLQPEEEVRAMIQQIDGQREAFAQKTYVCGEELQQLGPMTANQILEYHRAHPHLTVKIGDSGQVLFVERIDDLSPQCKQNAYFGLDGTGHLSLFEGSPQEQQVIRTFFQLNVEYLESSLPHETVKQLYRGIPVHNLDEFNSVLSTFADFAVEDTEKLAK